MTLGANHKKPGTRPFWFVNPWVIGGAVGFACVLTALVFSMVWVSRPDPAPIGAATAVLNITYVPTATLTLESPLPLVTIPPTVNPSPPPGVIAIGAFVQIAGTGGAGLRLRDKPGLDGEVLLLGVEAEVFRVDDGPTEEDGYTWWHLVGPFDETRQGWAVSNYLSVVQ